MYHETSMRTLMIIMCFSATQHHFHELLPIYFQTNSEAVGLIDIIFYYQSVILCCNAEQFVPCLFSFHGNFLNNSALIELIFWNMEMHQLVSCCFSASVHIDFFNMFKQNLKVLVTNAPVCDTSVQQRQREGNKTSIERSEKLTFHTGWPLYN